VTIYQLVKNVSAVWYFLIIFIFNCQRTNGFERQEGNSRTRGGARLKKPWRDPLRGDRVAAEGEG